MAVVLREDIKINGKLYHGVKTYKSSKPLGIVTSEEKEGADRLDKLIEEKIKGLRDETRGKDLIKLKKRKGVLELWHLVGRSLQFVDDESVIKPEDRSFMWEAIWYHLEKIAPELVPGKQIKRRGTFRDHLIQCYKVGKFPWDTIKNSGAWTDWAEFFDSRTISEDGRILGWVLEKTKGDGSLGKHWMRKFYRGLKREFFGKDTTVFPEEELKKKLSDIWEQTKSRN